MTRVSRGIVARIIVIDDDDAVRRIVRETLERAGHVVLDANDGETGLELVRTKPCDLVITDIFMPGMDGIVTLRQLRKERPDLKVIVMSGGDRSGRLDLRADAEFLGAAVTLRKPFRPAELVKVIDELLKGEPDVRR